MCLRYLMSCRMLAHRRVMCADHCGPTSAMKCLYLGNSAFHEPNRSGFFIDPKTAPTAAPSGIPTKPIGLLSSMAVAHQNMNPRQAPPIAPTTTWKPRQCFRGGHTCDSPSRYAIPQSGQTGMGNSAFDKPITFAMVHSVS